MKTIDIINSINENFANTYRSSSKFVESGEVWDFCIATIQNPDTLRCIVFANDLGIPPVKSLVFIYGRQKNLDADSDFKFDEEDRKAMGCLMGYVFKHILGYKKQKDRCKVNFLGVQTAARFLEGPVVEFEI